MARAEFEAACNGAIVQSLWEELITDIAMATATEVVKTQHAVMLMELRSTMLYAVLAYLGGKLVDSANGVNSLNDE